jgi:hypothetical protein
MGWRFNAAALRTMKQENDKPLSDLLGQWKLAESLPPRFQESVWRRIAQAKTKVSLWEIFAARLETLFRHPALATSFVGLLLFIGLTTGHWQAHDKMEQAQAHWSTLYVQSVDPYQTPRH